MEAVAALGVAAAAAQFLGIGLKTLVLCKHINEQGSTEVNQELEHNIDELKKIHSELRQNTALPASDCQIVRTRDECIKNGCELLMLLASLKANTQSRTYNLTAGIRAVRSNGKIKKFQARFLDSQKRFQSAVSVKTRNDVALLLERQGKSDDTIRSILVPEFCQGREESFQNHLKTHKELAQLTALLSAA
ncbi:hypothetical protein Q7P36_009004 [Cladosporium allicinum]